MNHEDEVFQRLIEEAVNDPVGLVYKELGKDIFDAPDIGQALAARDPDERAFLALVMCSAEIENGGFEQLFGNSADQIARHGSEGAERWGLARHAAIIREGWDRWVREDGMNLDKPAVFLDELDKKWFSLDEELRGRLLEFARQGQRDV